MSKELPLEARRIAALAYVDAILKSTETNIYFIKRILGFFPESSPEVQTLSNANVALADAIQPFLKLAQAQKSIEDELQDHPGREYMD